MGTRTLSDAACPVSADNPPHLTTPR